MTTLPKSLEKMMNEMALQHDHTAEPNEFKAGFQSACAILLPEIEKLTDTLDLLTENIQFHANSEEQAVYLLTMKLRERIKTASDAIADWQKFKGEG